MRRAALALALAACGKSEPRPYDHSAARGVFDEVDFAGPPGLSDLALDPRGQLWAIPERDRVLVELTVPAVPTPANAGLYPTVTHPLDGVPDGDDTESLTWLGPDQIALGLEGRDEGTATIAYAERRGDRFVVTRTRPLLSRDLGVTMKKNHGAEGLCGTADNLLVAIEEVGRLPDGGRYAPIVWLAGDTAPRVYRLRLGSKTGKISTLQCAFGADGTAHVAAIERHFGVSLIVRFDVPPVAAAEPIAETVVLDLGTILRDSLNLEGIATLPDKRVVAIADNQSKAAVGPDVMLVFAPNVHIE